MVASTSRVSNSNRQCASHTLTRSLLEMAVLLYRSPSPSARSLPRSRRRSGVVRADVAARLSKLGKFGLEVGDHAAIVCAAADARRRSQDFQLAQHAGDRFVELRPQRLV